MVQVQALETSAVDSLWKKIVQQAHTFATKHSIDTRITERRKTRKLMDGETARDETRDGEERLRVFMFIPVLDELCVQMMDRFSDEQCQLLKEIALLSIS